MTTLKQIAVCFAFAAIVVCAGKSSVASILPAKGCFSNESQSSIHGLIDELGSESAAGGSSNTRGHSDENDSEPPYLFDSDCTSLVPSSSGTVLSIASAGGCLVPPSVDFCSRPVATGSLYVIEFLRIPTPPIRTLLKIPISL